MDDETCEKEGVCAVLHAQEGKGKFCKGEPLKPEPKPEPPVQPPQPPAPTPLPIPDPVLPDVTSVDNGVVMAKYTDSQCHKFSKMDVFQGNECSDHTEQMPGLFKQSVCYKTPEGDTSALLQFSCKGSCQPDACQDPVETPLLDCIRTSDVECLSTGVCSKLAMEVGNGCEEEESPVEPPEEPPSIGPVEPPVDPEPIEDFNGIVAYTFPDGECGGDATVARRFSSDENCVAGADAGVFSSAMCRETTVTQFACKVDVTPPKMENGDPVPKCDAFACQPELRAELDMCYTASDMPGYQGPGIGSVLFAQEGNGFCKKDPFIPPPEDPGKPEEPPAPVIPDGEAVDGIVAYVYQDKFCQSVKEGLEIVYGPNECQALEGSNLFKYSACTAGEEFELFDCMEDDCNPDSCYASEQHVLNECRMLSAESCSSGACSVLYTTHTGDLESICKDDPAGPEYDPDKPVIPAPIPGARGIAAFVYSDALCKNLSENDTYVYDSGTCESDCEDKSYTFSGCSDGTFHLYDCDMDSCSAGSCQESEAHQINQCIEQSVTSCMQGVCSIMYVVQGDDQEEPVCETTPSPIRPKPSPSPSPSPSPGPGSGEDPKGRKTGAEKRSAAKNPFADAGISLPVGVGAAAGFLVLVAAGFFMYSRRRVSARYRSQTAALQLKVAGLNAGAAAAAHAPTAYPNPIQQQGAAVYV